MKILLLAPSRSIHTHKWALYYKNKGINVKVVTFIDHFSEENAREVDTESLPKLLPGKLSYLSAVTALKKIIKQFKPDILHAHYVSSYGLTGALANFHPYYVSVWGRDIFTFPQNGTVNRKMVEFTLGRADVICSTSHVMAKETNKYIDADIHVTPFGVDLETFKPAVAKKGQDDLIVGTVKALSDKYGIGDLVKAFAMIYPDFPQAKLLIVGDGPQKDEYIQMAQQLGISEVTTFTGRVPNTDVPNFINEMDVFAVPSTEDSESFGVAAVEAMACGVPVVVSNVGGLPEVVLEGVTGYVVPKENPDALAKAIQKLLLSADTRKQFGENGIKHVASHYNWLDNAAGMVELYEKTLSGGVLK